MEKIKILFGFSKHDVFYIVIGIVFVVVTIKKLYPFIKAVLVKRKEFYENFDGKFSTITTSINKIEKGQNIIFEIMLNNMVDKYSEIGIDHFADEKFARLMNKYEEVGNGNSESIKEQWKKIPFRKDIRIVEA